MNIGLSTLTLAMPPGQLKYARLVAEPEAQADVEMEGELTAVVGSRTELASSDAKTDSVDAPTESKKAGGESPAYEVDAKINETLALEDVKPEEEVPMPGIGTDANGLVITTDEEGQEPPMTAPETLLGPAAAAAVGVLLAVTDVLLAVENSMGLGTVDESATFRSWK